jgi:hypothetical protein
MMLMSNLFSGVLLLSFSLIAYGDGAASSDVSHDPVQSIKEGVRVRNVSVDRHRDGPVDYKIQFDIASSTSGVEIAVECAHREPGVASWVLFTSVEDKTNKASADGTLIGQALVLAAKTLHHDYSSDPIWAVCLPPASMPGEFTKPVLQAVSEEMRVYRSKPLGFNDQRVREIVARAYRRMQAVRKITMELERNGFSVRIDADELCHLRRSVADRTWDQISALPDAGLDLENARCWLFLGARDEK